MHRIPCITGHFQRPSHLWTYTISPHTVGALHHPPATYRECTHLAERPVDSLPGEEKPSKTRQHVTMI